MKRIRTDNRGAALVEFALVALLFCTLVFGVIEFSLLMKDYLTVSQAAREGARSAALGSPRSVVIDRVVDSAPTITLTDANSVIVIEKLIPGADPPPSLGDTNDGMHNDAQPGDLVHVHVEYDHPWITGLFGSGVQVVSGDMVMRRE
jgi:Flp pilus assembly protein TadG